MDANLEGARGRQTERDTHLIRTQLQVQHFFCFAEKNNSFGKYESSTESWDRGIAEFRAANILRTGGEWKGGTEQKNRSTNAGKKRCKVFEAMIASDSINETWVIMSELPLNFDVVQPNRSNPLELCTLCSLEA